MLLNVRMLKLAVCPSYLRCHGYTPKLRSSSRKASPLRLALSPLPGQIRWSGLASHTAALLHLTFPSLHLCTLFFLLPLTTSLCVMTHCSCCCHDNQLAAPMAHWSICNQLPLFHSGSWEPGFAHVTTLLPCFILGNQSKPMWQQTLNTGERISRGKNNCSCDILYKRKSGKWLPVAFVPSLCDKGAAPECLHKRSI